MDQNNNKKPDSGKNSNWRGFIHLICWAVLLAVLVSYATTYMTSMGHQASSVELEYSVFLDMLDFGKVAGVDFDNSESILIITPADGYIYTDEEGIKYTKTTFEDGTSGYTFTNALGQEQKAFLELFTVRLQSYDAIVEHIRELNVQSGAGKEGEGIRINQDYQPPMSPIVLFLVNLAPFFIIILVMSLVMSWMAKKGMGGIGGIGGVGKSNAKVYMEKSTGVTFRDVAGQDEAKESLTEIIDFLHNPGKYTEIGAKLPKGALLVGPPGTGKTLLAKAVAGEAGVPFFSISGSDFVEMFVGVGASRVRDLFKEASKVAPCIVFIDEIDTIGKSRDNRMGGNDEREQTLNQLLAEMDGFDPTKGVILLAATNRPEVLDQALLRPGRFDRRITIDRPNLAGRIATLEVHTRNIKLAEDVNLKKVALATAGCVGADLANLVTEADRKSVV